MGHAIQSRSCGAVSDGIRQRAHAVALLRVGADAGASGRTGSVERAVRVGAAGRQEGEELEPVAALREVEVGDEHRGFVARRLDEDPAVGVGDEGGAVEVQRPSVP